MVTDAQRAGDLQDATDQKLERATAHLAEVETELASKKMEYEELFGQLERASAAIESLERPLREAEAARPSDPKLDEIATLMRGLTRRLEPVD